MKYRFITILHNIEIEGVRNKGQEIFPGARISNGTRIIKDTVQTDLMKLTLGVHSAKEFNGKVYVYIDGEVKDVHNKEQMDKIGTQKTFFFLRQIQQFVHCLWGVKDNNVYVRDGFLLAYHKHFEDGFTYKASLSAIFSYSSGEQLLSSFSGDELTIAIKSFSPLQEDALKEDSVGGRDVDSDFFFKSKGSNRLTRAAFFTISARGSAHIPMKIVAYCNALECLFTVGTSEVNHKIAERVALMLGTSEESKKEFYKLIKTAYSCRSKIVHGQHLGGDESQLVNISRKLDSILREFFKHEHDVFSKKDDEMENFFLDLLVRENPSIS